MGGEVGVPGCSRAPRGPTPALSGRGLNHASPSLTLGSWGLAAARPVRLARARRPLAAARGARGLAIARPTRLAAARRPSLTLGSWGLAIARPTRASLPLGAPRSRSGPGASLSLGPRGSLRSAAIVVRSLQSVISHSGSKATVACHNRAGCDDQNRRAERQRGPVPPERERGGGERERAGRPSGSEAPEKLTRPGARNPLPRARAPAGAPRSRPRGAWDARRRVTRARRARARCRVRRAPRGGDRDVRGSSRGN